MSNATVVRAVRERPILFSGAMVRAILDGHKTETRRVLTTGRRFEDCSPIVCDLDRMQDYPDGTCRPVFIEPDGTPFSVQCPYGTAGDRLWVRETWYDNLCGRTDEQRASREEVIYRADGEFADHFEQVEDNPRWSPSIHMPRWASRLTLDVTNVRVERLQDITSDDVLAEGVRVDGAPIVGEYRVHDPAELRHGYRLLWDSLNAPRGYGWNVNPWVWVVAFRRILP